MKPAMNLKQPGLGKLSVKPAKIIGIDHLNIPETASYSERLQAQQWRRVLGD